MQFKTKIVGTSHYGADAVAAVIALRQGEEIMLRREPDNKIDPLAISCWRGAQHLGYVPKRENRELASEMDAGRPLRAVVMDAAIVRQGSIWPGA